MKLGGPKPSWSIMRNSSFCIVWWILNLFFWILFRISLHIRIKNFWTHSFLDRFLLLISWWGTLKIAILLLNNYKFFLFFSIGWKHLFIWSWLNASHTSPGVWLNILILLLYIGYSSIWLYFNVIMGLIKVNAIIFFFHWLRMCEYTEVLSSLILFKKFSNRDFYRSI